MESQLWYNANITTCDTLDPTTEPAVNLVDMDGYCMIEGDAPNGSHTRTWYGVYHFGRAIVRSGFDVAAFSAGR